MRCLELFYGQMVFMRCVFVEVVLRIGELLQMHVTAIKMVGNVVPFTTHTQAFSIYGLNCNMFSDLMAIAY